MLPWGSFDLGHRWDIQILLYMVMYGYRLLYIVMYGYEWLYVVIDGYVDIWL